MRVLEEKALLYDLSRRKSGRGGGSGREMDDGMVVGDPVKGIEMN